MWWTVEEAKALGGVITDRIKKKKKNVVISVLYQILYWVWNVDISKPFCPTWKSQNTKNISTKLVLWWNLDEFTHEKSFITI